MKIGYLIDAFRPAEGPPPNTLGAFMRWCLSGAWPMLAVAVVFSALAGGMEAGTAYILGLVIDTAISSGPEQFFAPGNMADRLWRFGVLFADSTGVVRPVRGR